MITKESMVDFQEKFEKVRKLVEENSKHDPETEPFVSKYAAREILIGMEANMENLIRSGTPGTEEHMKIICMKAAVLLQLGTISIDTEELSVGEKYLNQCLELIKDIETKPEIAPTTLGLYNQLGILWSKREPENSKMYLEKAEAFYTSFKNSGVAPIDTNELFVSNIENHNTALAMEKFEKLFALTLYYLAQIYGVLGDTLKSSVYCHNTLKRQLESKDYEPIDWALNTATLSQFFMEKKGFKQARHHLAASSYMLDKYGAELNEESNNSEEHKAKVETYKHRSADVARCWAKYGLLLLSNSKERLLHHSEDIESKCDLSTDLSKLKLTEDSSVQSDDLQNLFFPTLDVSEYENQITDQFILVLDDARKVFLNIQQWLTKAQTYYTLNTLASDYIEIVLDQSQMYENYLFFDENAENRAKLYKRSADILEVIVKEVNPTYYLQYCRQIWVKLAHIYSDILDIKAEKLRESQERPTPHALSKINSLVEKSIANHNNFIYSFKDADDEVPKSVTEDILKPFLQAHFYIAALCSRYISLDKKIQLEHTEASYKAYKRVWDLCEKNPKAAELVPIELSIVKEMVPLLPLKIEKLKREIQQSG